MSTITKEFTKEQLQQIIETDHVQCGEASALARIALASLEAEAVPGLFFKCTEIEPCPGKVTITQAMPMPDGKYHESCFKLYTAPPAPVSVPDDVLKGRLPDAEKAEFWFEHNGKILFEGVKFNNAVFDACRAAMLQGAEPVTTACKLRDAVEIIRNSGIAIDGEKILAERNALNSPVIPDGWVACSERMPEVGVKVLCFPVNDEPIHATYNGQVWLQDISWSVSDEPIDNVISCNVFHWMPLPAAPQQEGTQALAKGMERYGDAMQELAKKEVK